MKLFLESADKDPTLMLVLPMAKAALYGMKAAQEFNEERGIVEPGSGQISFGASKRGWLHWMVAAASDTEIFPPILGVIPLVPIVPDL